MELVLRIAFCLGVVFSFLKIAKSDPATVLKLLEGNDYEMMKMLQRPPGVPDKKSPCVVEIDIKMASIGPVSNKDMTVKYSFYLRQQWRDVRLSYNQSEQAEDDFITIGDAQMNKLWTPDLMFPLARKSDLHDITKNNRFLRLFPNGTILYSQRITSLMSCKMDLDFFPHDSQTCHIRMWSYGYTTKDLVFIWSTQRVPISGLEDGTKGRISEFTVKAKEASDCTEDMGTGVYTCLDEALEFKRRTGYYLTSTYIPSILIVVLSWIAFWVDHGVAPARVAVGLITVLTITAQSSGSRAELPRVSYIKAIDIWMSASLGIVFAAFIEYAIVLVLSRRFKEACEMEKYKLDNINSMDTDKEHGIVQVTVPKKKENWGSRVDFHCRYIFPLVYITFVVIYLVLCYSN